METATDDSETELRTMASRAGRRAFGWAAAVEMACITMIVFAAMVFGWRNTHLRGNGPERDFASFVLDDSTSGIMFIAAIAASLAFIAVAWLVGGLGGKWIVARKQSHGWVGPLVMLVPTLIGPFVGAVVIGFLDRHSSIYMERDPFEYFLAPWGVASLLLLLPGIIAGVLGGMVLRLRMNERAERAAWGPHPLEMDHDDHLAALATKASMRPQKLGTLVYGVGAALIVLICYLPAMVIPYYPGHFREEIFPFAAAAVAFWFFSLLVGRLAGALTRHEIYSRWWTGAGLMALPSLIASFVYVVTHALNDEYLSYALRANFLKAGLLPVFETTLVYMVPGVAMSILATLVMKHLGKSTSLEN